MKAEEEVAQLGRQGKSDHEVGSVDALVEFAFDPGGGICFAALRAGPVVAAMVSKRDLATVAANEALTAHGRRAASGDGSNGTPDLGRQASMFSEKRRQKPAQRRDDGQIDHLIFRSGWIGGLESQAGANPFRMKDYRGNP